MSTALTDTFNYAGKLPRFMSMRGIVCSQRALSQSKARVKRTPCPAWVCVGARHGFLCWLIPLPGLLLPQKLGQPEVDLHPGFTGAMSVQVFSCRRVRSGSGTRDSEGFRGLGQPQVSMESVVQRRSCRARTTSCVPLPLPIGDPAASYVYHCSGKHHVPCKPCGKNSPWASLAFTG